MAIRGDRMSTYTQASTSTDRERPGSGHTAQRDLWSSMLDGVASGKRLPEKNLLVLGGTGETQKEFLEALSTHPTKRAQDRNASKQPPLANNFALGYTYYDVLDSDHEDTLARLSLYLLADPSPAFTPLLRPLLTPQTIPNTLIVILLDWSEPWHWLRQLRDWIRVLRSLLISLDDDSKKTMEEIMIEWRDRGRGTISLDGSGTVPTDSDVILPLGPGEWDEALGLPLCVVCQHADKMEVLERERAWKEEEFDFVLQFLRTTLLKHGASLIYTTPSIPSSLQTLIHSSLGIQSLLKKQPLKPNVIDRDKVLVPPNWDSWGKIRVLREGFDVEGVNKGWSFDIEEDSTPSNTRINNTSETTPTSSEGALSIYEETIPNPATTSLTQTTLSATNGEIEVKAPDVQTFLATQFEILEKIKATSTSTTTTSNTGIAGRREGIHKSTALGSDLGSIDDGSGSGNTTTVDDGRVNEHIGPVQFNMGGIQVDADDMLQRLKDRQAHQTPEPESATSPGGGGGKAQNEALASFFAGLMNRGASSASPRP